MYFRRKEEMLKIKYLSFHLKKKEEQIRLQKKQNEGHDTGQGSLQQINKENQYI